MKEGRLFEVSHLQPEVRKNVELMKDWEYSQEAAYLYRMAVLFKDRFLDPVLLTDRRRLPDPVLSFDNLRNIRTLVAYTLHRNPQGLLDEIMFNNEHYITEEIVPKDRAPEHCLMLILRTSGIPLFQKNTHNVIWPYRRKGCWYVEIIAPWKCNKNEITSFS